jgi:pimeloyl-ACP methyl ester carboxylesterase/DNA-binding winged helix-turn-helix (wHTH) protein
MAIRYTARKPVNPAKKPYNEGLDSLAGKYSQVIYSFDNCTLDTEKYQLSVAGKPLATEPLVFDLLVYLIEHRDRVVTREELLDNLWKGKVVTDAALGARLKDVRRAVQDSGSRQAVIKTIHSRGYQFVAGVKALTQEPARQSQTLASTDIGLEDQSAVQYCRSRDGVSIAHAQVGEGYPVVITGSWMTHLQEDWQNPAWGPYLKHLARDFKLIRYDQRGNGMSDWNDVDISFDRMVDDLAAVIDCYDLQRFAILGCSQSAAVSAVYAARHPDRVSQLVLHGSYPRGRRRRGDAQSFAESEALVTLIGQSWGNENPAIRQTFTSLMMPGATPDEANWFNEFQRTCGPAANMARIREMFDKMSVIDMLEDIQVPTLVLHSTGDSIVPLAEGKLFASRIPGARFVTLNSKNHMLFENEADFARLIKSIRNFLRASNE